MDTEARLAIFAIVEKNRGNINGGQMESMCMLTHMISSVPIKDRTIVGTSEKIERMPIT